MTKKCLGYMSWSAVHMAKICQRMMRFSLSGLNKSLLGVLSVVVCFSQQEWKANHLLSFWTP